MFPLQNLARLELKRAEFISWIVLWHCEEPNNWNMYSATTTMCFMSYTFKIMDVTIPRTNIALRRRHNARDDVSNHQPRECLLNRLFKAQIKENIKAPRHWPLWGDRWIPRAKG